MADLTYTHRPLSDRTWLRPANDRVPSRFDSDWTSTQNLLARELAFLGAEHVVLEVDVAANQLKRDGMLRARAIAESPAVVLAFVSETVGPQQHRCDRFDARWSDRPGWAENVRAIALTLEALRAVDRYGSGGGAQYVGYRAIEAGTGDAPSGLTDDGACLILASWSGIPHDDVIRNTDGARTLALRRARAATHPDVRPDRAKGWSDVEEAARALRLTKKPTR